MRAIVVATDFSKSAANAASYAAAMALTLQAEMFLLHAYEMPVSTGEVSLPVDVDALQSDAESALKSLQDKLEKQTNGKLSIRGQVHMGGFYNELTTVCEKLKPYAVVIGSTGKTAAERLLFGSNAVYTMKHLPWPVIAIPPGVVYSNIKKIGLACDLENVDALPLDEIGILLRDFQAEFHLLNFGLRTAMDSQVKHTSHLLYQKLQPLKTKFHFLDNGDVDQGILDFAEKKHIDLLVVIPKRKSLINYLLKKSHTRQFVLHSHVPVMALHMQQ
ncbi:universal stress protein [Pseudoflavitalea rhizosphaerae]|uniref:universal stress protein n=1 Tax=Pseudoflavitalea rhizosphaerae TaxID=1884793 RepID=UPI000F8D930D|nr:universal stress protein [Pseudoflavitalea rhizosphaerae]